MAPTPGAVAFLLGRAAFAVVVGFLAVGNLLDRESSVGYARSKGVPLAAVTVPLGSVVLVAGAVAVLVGAYPAVGGLAVAAVLVPITGLMHDFWTASGQERQNERIHFLKNVGLLGAALAFAGSTASTWSLALGVGV